MAQAVYYEARGESAEGQAAVAQVVLNRTRSGRHPSNVCGAVFEGATRPGCQFSFACDSRLAHRPLEAAAWRRAQGVAADVMAGHGPADLQTAENYHADYVRPRWAAQLQRTAEIGRHIFYASTAAAGRALAGWTFTPAPAPPLGRMNRAGGRRGFSFIEALVVLAVTSVLLILLFSVSANATRAGLRAAGRAGDTADRAVGVEALRTLVRAVRLPRRGGPATPFEGDADGFTAAAEPGRPTPCGPGAPTSALTLRLDRTGGRTRLLCAVPGRPGIVLLDLGVQTAALSYALAGRPWTDRLSARPPSQRSGAPPAPAPRARLWIRLAGADGFEVVESPDAPPPARTTSG